MPIIATAGDSKTYAPAPAGVHQAVCVDVVDMGLLEVTFNGKTKTQHKVRLVWQIDELDPERAERFIVHRRYTLSLHEKANLRKDLESWRGKAFTDDELKGFDLEDKLLGKNAFVNVVHVEKDGKIYANLAAVMPLKKGTPKIEPQKYIRVKDRKPDDGHGIPNSELPELTDDDIPF
jgi:hypothetical protein